MTLYDLYILILDKLELHTKEMVIIIHKTCHVMHVEWSSIYMAKF
jgi:hypothetical protein